MLCCATMLSILRRSYGGAVVSVSSIIANKNKKFPPLTRFVSSFSSSPLEIPKYDPNALTFPRDFCNDHFQAVRSFDTMLFGGVSPISDYNFVFETLVKMGSFSTVISLFNQLEESLEFNSNHKGYVSPDIHTWAILITCHSREGNMSKAISLFHKIIDSGHHPTTQALHDIFEGFCYGHEIQEAMLFYNDIILKKGLSFLLNPRIYLTLIHELCEIGETQLAIQLLRQALQIENEPEEYGFTKLCCFNSIIFRLCKDRLVNQAYDLYSEMVHSNNIEPDDITYKHLIYGHCVLGQFKQAIGLFRELEASRTLHRAPPVLVTRELDASRILSPTPPALVTEEEVKSAKSVAAIMIKGGVKPNAASYCSVNDGLFEGKGGSRSALMNKIAQKVKMLLRQKPKYYLNKYD